MTRTPDAPCRIERASANDLMELASDVGPAPMQVAAVLVLDGGATLEPLAVRDAIAQRIQSVPRLRQRLVRVPLRCGRPIWVDDADFDIDRHVRTVRCVVPGDEEALLAVAASAVTDRLSPDGPLWSATFVTGVESGNAGLIVVFDHVLADGIGGLAILAQLVDGAPAAPRGTFPTPPPSHRQLIVDAFVGRLRAFGHLRDTIGLLRGAIAELRPGATPRAPRCTLNRPTGPHRRFVTARADLDRVHRAAHAHRATVNDVVLAAVTGALHTLLRQRGEIVDTFVISIAASPRARAMATELGNQVGVIPVALPAAGDPVARLEMIARITGSRKAAPRGASAAVLGPVFRVLARLRLLHRFVNRQRLVNTFVTNLRGPDHRLSFLATDVGDLIAISATSGNISVAFAVLSYAGTLTVTIIADPDACPDTTGLAEGLRRQLDLLITTGAEIEPPPTPR